MILVTGANGFLGSFICKALADSGKNVKALVRNNSDTSLLEGASDKVQIVHGDILDMNSMEEHFEGLKILIHAAAIVSFHRSDYDQMSEVNIEGTKNMVNLSLKYKVDFFLHISSVAAIGRKEQKAVVSEKNKWEESKWNSHYGESKYLAELEVWRGIQEGLSGIVLNPSVVLGPGNWDISSSRLFKYAWQENKYYSEGLMNYVDVRDVTSIIMRFLEKQPSDERYIISAGDITYKDFFEIVARRFNKKPPYRQANKRLLRLGLIIEWVKSMFSSNRPLITTETINLSGSEISFDNSKIKKELNFNFTPLEQTVNWTCEKYLKAMSKN